MIFNIKIKWFYIFCFSLLFLYSLYERLANFYTTSLWQDELAIYMHSMEPLSNIFNYSVNQAFHPPLLYFLLKPLYLFGGFGEFNLRVYHVFFGIFASLLPLFFVRGSKDKSMYFIFSLLLVSNLKLINLSKEALTYSFSIFLITLFLLLFEQFFVKLKKQFFYPILITTIFISYYSFFAGIIVAIFLISWFVLFEKDI